MILVLFKIGLRMKKINFLLITLLFSLTAQAQINVDTINKLNQNQPTSNNQPNSINANEASKFRLEIAKKNVVYNGSIVGYAKSCGFAETDYKKIEHLLFKNLNVVQLSHQQIDEMRDLFEDTVLYATSKGQSHSKSECELFEQEFKKIINAMGSSPTKLTK